MTDLMAIPNNSPRVAKPEKVASTPDDRYRPVVYEYLQKNYTPKHDPLDEIQENRSSWPSKGLTYYHIKDLERLLRVACSEGTPRGFALELQGIATKDGYVGREGFLRRLEQFRLVERVATYCTRRCNYKADLAS